MRTRDALVGVFAGVMSIGAGSANAACVLTPRLTIMEVMEGQSAHIEAVCEEALETINWQVKEVKEVDGVFVEEVVDRTRPQLVESDPKAVLQYQPPSAVLNKTGYYNVGVLGRLADGSAVYSRAEAWVTVLDPKDTDITTATDAGTGTTGTTGTTPTVPSNVTVIETAVPKSSFDNTYWSVAPSTINAFKFWTQNTSAAVGQRIGVAVVPGADRGKLVEVSLSPGGPAVSTPCSSYDVQSSGFYYYINVLGYDSTNCVLEPDTPYYANVYSKYRVTDTTYNCGSSTSPDAVTSQCGFDYNHQ